MKTSTINRSSWNFVHKFFSKGWGDPNYLEKIIESHKEVSQRDTCKHFIKSLDIKLENERVESSSTIIDGSFISPFSEVFPGSMNSNNELARFQLIIPNKWISEYKPLCIHYPGTGDHNFTRRKRLLADRLIKDNIASLIHMNPFYGARKPKDQNGSSLNYLFDLFVMGGALILEAQVMLHWAKKHGFGPLALHGISMGGHMACLSASVYPEPVCLIPCLSWTTASHVFTEGKLSKLVAWDALARQYYGDEMFSRTLRQAIEPPVPYHLQTYDKKVLSNDDLLQISPQNVYLQSKKSYITLIRNVLYLNGNNSNRNNCSDKEVRDFMRDILDYFTHLGNFSVPIDPRLITAVVAEKDSYVPITGVAHFNDVWGPDCEVEVLKGRGHIGAYVYNGVRVDDSFREAIVRTLNRYIQLYHHQTGPFGKKKIEKK